MGQGALVSLTLHVAYGLLCGDIQPWIPVPDVKGAESRRTLTWGLLLGLILKGQMAEEP